MKTAIYKISNNGLEEVHAVDLFDSKENKAPAYIVDIYTNSRKDASVELNKLGISKDICEKITEPSEQIRFEYFGDAWYGELAYYSHKIKKSDYMGIIIHKNILIGIHSTNDGILSGLKKKSNELTEIEKYKINPEFLLYAIVLEILSKYGKLVLSYSEKIESLAFDLDENNNKLSPEAFLEAKTQLSVFSLVIGKLYYTLSFPPAKSILDTESSFQNYFDYLLKSMNLIKTSLKRIEERLESLNDHYQLLLQSKANKRLNLLTITQAIFVPLTLIVGVYGMNFEYMPILAVKYGYYISIGVMGTIASISLLYFYKNGWFK